MSEIPDPVSDAKCCYRPFSLNGEFLNTIGSNVTWAAYVIPSGVKQLEITNLHVRAPGTLTVPPQGFVVSLSRSPTTPELQVIASPLSGNTTINEVAGIVFNGGDTIYIGVLSTLFSGANQLQWSLRGRQWN